MEFLRMVVPGREGVSIDVRDLASGITGEILYVDAGYNIMAV